MATATMFDSQMVGLILAICSLVMTAIFPIFGKLERVKSSNINPMIFNIYFQSGVVLFCVIATIIIAVTGPIAIHFSYMGLTSGILLGIGGWFVWLALTYMGIAHTSAVASGIASVTGFIEGICIGYYPDNIPLSVFALFLIVIGIVGIGVNEALTSFILKRILCRSDNESVQTLTLNIDTHSNLSYRSPEALFRFNSHPYTTLNEDEDGEQVEQTEITPFTLNERQESADHETSALVNDAQTRAQMATTPITLRFWGIVFSVLGGVCFGSMAFPEEFTKPNTTEVYYLPSFGVGAMLMIVVDFAVVSLRMKDEQVWHLQACLVPGVASGMVWAVGFLAILYSEMLIDYSLAIPIRECSICVAVFIGIFGFKEVTDTRAIIVTFLCVCVVLVGVFLLPLGIA
eukprot:CAMPEP_0197051242 /NCGR_PEP_ID=MMETSP1384-20130603/25955_1 /TAXON_ID=29189 /ORGANISM="Ammonia sp." /LENGTH=401 /DNA_ID=CAMNT_0042483771 /DNA_START=45 /DNA_END=1250 /DNA_ORIENTATION=+